MGGWETLQCGPVAGVQHGSHVKAAPHTAGAAGDLTSAVAGAFARTGLVSYVQSNEPVPVFFFFVVFFDCMLEQHSAQTEAVSERERTSGSSDFNQMCFFSPNKTRKRWLSYTGLWLKLNI